MTLKPYKIGLFVIHNLLALLLDIPLTVEYNERVYKYTIKRNENKVQ